ncbi:MAG: peptide deformylase [Prevotellaceae bacterium]|jgi:peptide deformylase|nr:peptide deformylase [Prevotellaceae bacterium]
MILPIYTYGSSVLRKKSEPITKDFPELKTLVENMFETMYHAKGVGLAAPQIGQDIRVLVIDFKELEDEDLRTFKVAMVNPEMLEMSEETETKEEGCLSIPGINENVVRSKSLKIRYLDVNFDEHTEEFTGFRARAIQHEYDHLEGALFTDKVAPLRRQFIKTKLNSIIRGKATCDYKTKSA